PVEVDDEDVSRQGGLNIKRTSFGIAAEYSGDALIVGSGRVHGCGVNRVARPDVQHRRSRCRELAVERGAAELVPLGGPGASRRYPLRRPGGLERIRLVFGGADHRAADAVGRDRARELFGRIIVREPELNGVAVYLTIGDRPSPERAG